MPVTLNPFGGRRFPMWMIVLLPIGALLAGHAMSNLAAQAPVTDAATFTKHGTRIVTTTRTVKRRVHGKVVTRNEQIYVQVPVVVVHTDHHTIKVPQHLLPLRSAAATVANPLVTVLVTVPQTIYQPVTVTSTMTVTDTEFVPTTITLTVPLEPTGGLPTDPQ